jgi:hypothetical protein
VKLFELVAAALFAAMGVRSVAYWVSRPFESEDRVDHALYALYVAGRAGLWFAFAGLFLIFGLNDAEGRAFVDEANDVRWYVVIFALLGVAQLLGGWFLGRRGGGGARG